jgi:glutamate 5-kinase
MGIAGDILNKSRKLVLKIGSNVLADESGKLDSEIVAGIAGQVAVLMKAGKQVIIVSSGAGVSGATAVGLLSRRDDMNFKQALCAVGQVELMLAYKKQFVKYDRVVGQILLTRGDFTDAGSRLHIRNTLFTLIDEGCIPIINENDTVGIEEFSLGDNDLLAAHTANLWNADMLILMSDIDGVFNKPPKDHSDARLIPVVEDIDALEAAADIGVAGAYGTGGMASKIEAARTVAKFGMPMLLVNGKTPDILGGIAGGRLDSGTVFVNETKYLKDY